MLTLAFFWSNLAWMMPAYIASIIRSYISAYNYVNINNYVSVIISLYIVIQEEVWYSILIDTEGRKKYIHVNDTEGSKG